MSIATPPRVVAALLAELRAACESLCDESNRLIAGSQALRADGQTIRQLSTALRTADLLPAADAPLGSPPATPADACRLRDQARDLAWRCYTAMSRAQDAGNHAHAARLRRLFLRSRARYKRRRLALALAQLASPATSAEAPYDARSTHSAAWHNDWGRMG